MDVVEDGPAQTTAKDWQAQEVQRREGIGLEQARTKGMTESLRRAIQRDPNPNGLWKRATLSEDGTSLVTDHEGRTYILTVREV